MQDRQCAAHRARIAFGDRAVPQQFRSVVRAETEEFGKKFEHPLLDRIAPVEWMTSRGRCVCLGCHGAYYFERKEKYKAAGPAASESRLIGNGELSDVECW